MKVAPSILDANFQMLQQELDSLAGCNRIHLDIMDGHYVPNMSFGASILHSVSFPAEIEAHLMVNNPERFFESFLELGVSGITFHIENTGRTRAQELLSRLKSRGVRAGICIDGYTDPAFLSDEIIALADQILCMSVKAGFGGQSFMPAVSEKIRSLRERGYTGEIEVDGGVSLENAPLLKKAGADIVVVGSFLMRKAAAERAEVIEAFRGI